MKNLQLSPLDQRILAKAIAIHASAKEEKDLSKKVDLFIQFGAMCAMLNGDPWAIMNELNQQHEQNKE